MPVKLLRFDGCEKGDEVHVKLMGFIEWRTRITKSHRSDKEISFVDTGGQLPFFFRRWRHHHRIQNDGATGSTIIEDITFSTGYLLTDYLLYPLLYIQFLYRIPIYQKRFGRK